jgi:hypothetical protein
MELYLHSRICLWRSAKKYQGHLYRYFYSRQISSLPSARRRYTANGNRESTRAVNSVSRSDDVIAKANLSAAVNMSL